MIRPPVNLLRCAAAIAALPLRPAPRKAKPVEPPPPSINEMLERSPSLMVLEAQFNYAYANAEAAPATKTQWAQTYIRRQLAILRNAPTAEELCGMYNLLMFTFKVHPSVEPLIESIFQLRAKELPSSHERYLLEMDAKRELDTAAVPV